MRRLWILGLCATLLAGLAGAAGQAKEGWNTYRSGKFGFELSYPSGTEYRAYVDGSSAELRDAATGHTLARFDVSPPFECPRQRADAIAKEIGIEQAKAMTQTDGPDGSSYCGDPVTVREFTSPQGVRIYELELPCVRESYPGSHDDTDETEAEAPPVEAEPVITEEGTKGPTFFADISPSWMKRVLLADPAGVDPRVGPTYGRANAATLREILETLKTFPAPKPPTVCIEELRNQPFSIGIPPR